MQGKEHRKPHCNTNAVFIGPQNLPFVCVGGSASTLWLTLPTLQGRMPSHGITLWIRGLCLLPVRAILMLDVLSLGGHHRNCRERKKVVFARIGASGCATMSPWLRVRAIASWNPLVSLDFCSPLLSWVSILSLGIACCAFSCPLLKSLIMLSQLLFLQFSCQIDVLSVLHCTLLPNSLTNFFSSSQWVSALSQAILKQTWEIEGG